MKEYEISATKNKKTKALDISMEGHLNVSNISGIQKKLDKIVKKNNSILLDISNVEDADLTFIQLLVGFRQNCQSSNIELKINLDLSPESLELFRRAGFSNTFN